MKGNVVWIAFLLFGATALQADVFSFSYSGVGLLGGTVSGNGTVTATQALPGIYTITSISGTQNGVSFSMTGTGNTLVFSGGTGTGAFDLLVKGVGTEILSFAGSVYGEAGPVISNGTNFKIAGSVPEVSTISLLFTMGLGVWIVSRKLSSRKRTTI